MAVAFFSGSYAAIATNVEALFKALLIGISFSFVNDVVAWMLIDDGCVVALTVVSSGRTA